MQLCSCVVSCEGKRFPHADFHTDSQKHAWFESGFYMLKIYIPIIYLFEICSNKEINK